MHVYTYRYRCVETLCVHVTRIRDDSRRRKTETVLQRFSFNTDQNISYGVAFTGIVLGKDGKLFVICKQNHEKMYKTRVTIGHASPENTHDDECERTQVTHTSTYLAKQNPTPG